jgi:uncharacterized protein (TIGR03118 family)
MTPRGRFLKQPLIGSAIGIVCMGIGACGGGGGMRDGSVAMSTSPAGDGSTSGYTDTALVVDKQEVVATTTVIDDKLQNPWGIAVAKGQPFWIADNNSNVSTLYTGKGEIETQTVTGSPTAAISIPSSAAGVASNPTGQVFDGGGGFLITTPKGQESALFLFVGEGGTLAAWAQDSGATAVTAYDDGIANGAAHAVYKGLALGSVSGASYLYATDLHNNKVDVFDTGFSKPAAMQGKFKDSSLPAGFVPFGITALDGQLYVTYAMQDSAKHDEMTGAGLGYVDIFDFSGNLVSRFASGGVLNAPWGMALAPAGFGSLAGDILIGNFGDGTINVFVPQGASPASSLGSLRNSNGQPLAFAGLWSLVFGNGDSDKPATTLFYTAGFADQTDGVFGAITAASSAAPTPY